MRKYASTKLEKTSHCVSVFHHGVSGCHSLHRNRRWKYGARYRKSSKSTLCRRKWFTTLKCRGLAAWSLPKNGSRWSWANSKQARDPKTKYVLLWTPTFSNKQCHCGGHCDYILVRNRRGGVGRTRMLTQYFIWSMAKLSWLRYGARKGGSFEAWCQRIFHRGKPSKLSCYDLGSSKFVICFFHRSSGRSVPEFPLLCYQLILFKKTTPSDMTPPLKSLDHSINPSHSFSTIAV
jgi:hypothetical protein